MESESFPAGTKKVDQERTFLGRNPFQEVIAVGKNGFQALIQNHPNKGPEKPDFPGANQRIRFAS
jgi:hypothetical protein